MAARPKVSNLPIAVYAPPGEDGVVKLEVGKADLKAGTLVIEFNTRMPAEAIQRLMQRRAMFGLVIMLMEDELVEAAEKSEAEFAERKAAAIKAREEEKARDEGVPSGGDGDDEGDPSRDR